MSAVYNYLKSHATAQWPKSSIHVSAWGNTGLKLDAIEIELERLEAAGLIVETETRPVSDTYTERLFVVKE